MLRINSLRRITDDDTAHKILRMMEGEADPRAESAACDRWVRQCHHMPSHDDQVMEAANELLGLFGVEGCADSDGRDGVSYCNTGDTYADTLVLDHGTFGISSLGSLVERHRIS